MKKRTTTIQQQGVNPMNAFRQNKIACILYAISKTENQKVCFDNQIPMPQGYIISIDAYGECITDRGVKMNTQCFDCSILNIISEAQEINDLL